MSTARTETTRTSHSGLTLPKIGFGTYKLKGAEGSDAVVRAIDKGYTLLDSAYNYENEGTVGNAVQASGVSREDLIVTSKLPGRYQKHDDALTTIEESVYRTGLDYIDLYLIHWPNPNQGLYVEAWEAMIEARERGLIKAIGVSNFLPEHLETLEKKTGVLPDVNQIELHPYFPQTEQLAYDAEHGILTESWSPIGRGNDLLGRKDIGKIAEAHNATPGQVVLAWHIARGAIPIPKAASDKRQLENLAAVDIVLDPAEVDAITALGSPDGRLKDQDPAAYEEF